MLLSMTSEDFYRHWSVVISPNTLSNIQTEIKTALAKVEVNDHIQRMTASFPLTKFMFSTNNVTEEVIMVFLTLNYQNTNQ